MAATKAATLLQQLDGVVIGRPNLQGAVQVFGFSSSHGAQGPHHHVGVDAATAAQTPTERSLERIEQITQQHRTQEQQVENQEAQRQSGPQYELHQ
nr:hypothetical protein [Lysobacter sp. Root690]